jgi:hypothetical protein
VVLLLAGCKKSPARLRRTFLVFAAGGMEIMIFLAPAAFLCEKAPEVHGFWGFVGEG